MRFFVSLMAGLTTIAVGLLLTCAFIGLSHGGPRNGVSPDWVAPTAQWSGVFLLVVVAFAVGVAAWRTQD